LRHDGDGGTSSWLTSHEIVGEIDRVLHLPRIQVKYRLAESDIQAFILALLYMGSCVSGRLALSDIAPDPGDDKVISCAVEGEARFIVTGDKALQRLEEYRGIRIISADQFVRILGRPTQGPWP
jgi:uncharacterized protein